MRSGYLFLLFAAILVPLVSHAHGIGQLPFVTINGQFVMPYPVTVATLAPGLPEDTAPEKYVVNTPLTFAVNQGAVSFGPVLQNGVTLEWQFGDGITGTGMTVDHTYIKPSSYTVTLAARYSYSTQPQVIDTILVRSELSLTPSNHYRE